MKVAALAGGVGGAKLADGLMQLLKPDELTIIVNTGDDFNHLGLSICPDLDTVCYTLAGLANPETGWGRINESWAVLTQLERLGGPAWFRLGDLDLATHLERSRRLGSGSPLHEVTQSFCEAWGVKARVIPMSNQSVSTWVDTIEKGWLPFQEYFVREQCNPSVKGFEFRGAASAAPAPGVLDALSQADAIVICPSNPWVSIGPILAIPGITEALCARKDCLAVSPLIGGKTIKGPAAKMYLEMGIEPSNVAVAKHYQDFLSILVIDLSDQADFENIQAIGITPLVRNTMMRTRSDRKNLASELLSAWEATKGGK